MFAGWVASIAKQPTIALARKKTDNIMYHFRNQTQQLQDQLRETLDHVLSRTDVLLCLSRHQRLGLTTSNDAESCVSSLLETPRLMRVRAAFLQIWHDCQRKHQRITASLQQQLNENNSPLYGKIGDDLRRWYEQRNDWQSVELTPNIYQVKEIESPTNVLQFFLKKFIWFFIGFDILKFYFL